MNQLDSSMWTIPPESLDENFTERGLVFPIRMTHIGANDHTLFGNWERVRVKGNSISI